MNVKSVEKLEKSMVALTIEADAQEFEAAIEKVYKKQRGRIAIPGFRKGKAPRKIVESMYGEDVFYEDAINEIYPDLFAQAVEQENVDAVAYPQVELLEAGKNGFTFKATVAVRPEVTLGEYKGLTVPKETVEVTEADIDSELLPYIQRATQLVDVDREARMGDSVIIDFAGYMDGEAFDGGTATDQALELGSNVFIPGFEEQIVGMKTGEEKDIDVTFPEDYQMKDYAGKPATFKVKLHSIREKNEPTLDDEFAKDVSEFETLADFRADLGKKLADRREAKAQGDFEEALLDQVTENMTCDIPEAMVDYRTQQMLDDYSQRIVSQGIPFDKYLEMTGLTENILKMQAHEGALRQVKVDLALGAIAQAEGIEVTQEDMDAECARLAEQYGMDVEQVKEIVPVSDLQKDLSNQKAAKIVFDSAKIGEAPAKEPETEEPEAEKKPAKKTTRKTTKKAEGEEGEKKPARKSTKKAPKAEAETEAEAGTEE